MTLFAPAATMTAAIEPTAARVSGAGRPTAAASAPPSFVVVLGHQVYQVETENEHPKCHVIRQHPGEYVAKKSCCFGLIHQNIFPQLLIRKICGSTVPNNCEIYL